MGSVGTLDTGHAGLHLQHCRLPMQMLMEAVKTLHLNP